MFVDLPPETLRTLALAVTAWAVAFVVALWVAMLVWVWRDIRARTRDLFLQLLALLVVGVLFVPGMAIYWLLRPPSTLEEDYRRALEEEALLQTLDDARRCPGCARRVEPDWIVCPHCHTKLRKVCQHCGRLLELPWNLCPYCGTPVPGMRREDLTLDEVLASVPSPKDESVIGGEEGASENPTPASSSSLDSESL